MGSRATAELIGGSHFSGLEARARQSPRGRAVHCFHTGDGDNPHRFLNLLLEGTYVAPHRHATPPKAESFVVLQGELGVLLFDDVGELTAAHRLRAWGHAGRDGVTAGTEMATEGRELLPCGRELLPCGRELLPCGLDLLPGQWHSIVALTAVVVIFEVKPGPYDAATDKEFAGWAPGEGTAGAAAYQRWMESQFARTESR